MQKNKKLDVMFGRGITLEQGKGWFVGVWYDGLFYIDFEKKSIQLLKLLPFNNTMRDRAYSGCDKIGEYIYIYPGQMVGNIIITNLQGKVVKQIELKNPFDKEINIVDTFVYQEKIYIMSLGLKKFLY